MPTTLVPSEIIFSTVGQLISKKAPSSMTTQEQEESDIAKALELSLKDCSLYPIASVCNATKAAKEHRQVKALYDFEAAEDNEITFKTADIITVLDDSDANWWKGSYNDQEGLFPAHFVVDLTTESTPSKPEKTVRFNEEVKVKEIVKEAEEIQINEAKIDLLLHLLHEADPSALPENGELLALEDTCFAMASLIEQELEDIDRNSASLNASNQKLVDALNFYQTSMPYNYAVPHTDVMRIPPMQDQHQVIYGAPLQTNYLPNSYQRLNTPNSEHFQAPLAPSGAVPTSIEPCMMHSESHPHIDFGRTNENFASIPQTTLTVSSGKFSAPLPSRDQNIFYGDMGVASMSPSSAPLPLPRQPMS